MLTRTIADKFLKLMTNIEHGSLELVTPEGALHRFESGRPGPRGHFHLRSWDVITRMSLKGDVSLAEDYSRGRWDTRNLNELVLFGVQNARALGQFFTGNRFFGALANLAYALRLNTLRGSRRNISAHYDLGNEFYALWLDPSMTYSSAIYTGESETLEQAQYNKYDRILDRLGNAPGDVLEIGCGWGGFAERAVDLGGHRVRGITLSEAQRNYARRRLAGKSAEIALEDYRHQQGRFDNIVSIEMFEAVGEKYWPVYFDKIASLLKPGGRAVIQTITIDDDHFDSYRRGSDVIRSFIFPGGMLPSKSRFADEAARAGLKITDRHDFGRDYARTLFEWLENFDARREKLPALGFDDRFVRMWRFYLASCIAGFETRRTDVMQVELRHA